MDRQKTATVTNYLEFDYFIAQTIQKDFSEIGEDDIYDLHDALESHVVGGKEKNMRPKAIF